MPGRKSNKKSIPRKSSLRTLVLKNNTFKKKIIPEPTVVITKKGRFTVERSINQKGSGNPKVKCQKCSGLKTYNSQTKRCLSKKSQKGRKIEKCKKNKIAHIMTEFRTRKLKTKNGITVSSPPQAIAIALSIACKTC